MEMEAASIVNADDTLSVPVRVKGKSKALPLGAYTKFADSPLWGLQRQHYKNQGLKPWSQGQVPHYVTSNPFIAKAYAEVALGFWRDLKAKGKTGQPLYIIELGAGCGRFAYHFLLHFFEAFDAIRGADDKVCYVMTDFAPGTVAQWQHPIADKLKPFVEQGRLDFALFDAEKGDAENGDAEKDDEEADIQLFLQQQKIALTTNSLALPPVVISNYVFSGLRQDLFFLENERIYEGWLALAPKDGEANTEDPDHPFAGLKLDYQKRRITTLPYADSRWNSLIESFAKRLPPCALLFPAYALNAIARLGKLHGGHLLLLSADRSTHELKELARQQEPDIARHGSFSLPVNYHAIASVIQHQGGSCWTSAQNDGLAIFAACWQPKKLAQHTQPWRETELATKQAFRTFSPGDFYRIKQTLETEAEYLNPEQMLAFLRLSKWDTKVFYLMFAYIYDDLAQLPAQQQNEWYSALAEVWRYHLPIGEDYDLAYDLALLAAELNRWQSAIYLFLQSLQRANETQNQSAAYFNLGIAHWQIAAYSKAESYLVKALALAENEEKLAAENAEQTDVIAEPAANTIAGENSEEQNSIVGEQDIAAQDDDGDEDLDDDDDDDGDDDLDDDNEEHEEQNPAESQTLTISAQLTELRTWQARCQTILGAETLRLPATSPANPKALYASLLGPHQALALYRLQWDPELAALAGVECLRSTEHARAWIGQEQSEQKHVLAILHPEFGLIGVAALECPPQALQPGGSRSGRFYYWIGEEYQWQGYGTQAMQLLHQLAGKIGVLHIFSTVDKTNIASQRALAKLGYQRLPFDIIGERPGYRYHHFGQPLNEAALHAVLTQLLTELNSGISLAPLAQAEPASQTLEPSQC